VKILAVCGSGLGSSLMLAMSVKDVLKKMGVSGVQVEHSDLSGATKDMADYIICGKDIAKAMERFDNVIILNSILSKQEITEKLTLVLKDKNYIN